MSNTAQPLYELISQNLIQWFQNPHQPHEMAPTHPLKQASLEQQAIGWQHFLWGRIATSIIQYQEEYYRARECPVTDTDQAWAKKLIKTLWAHFLTVWKLQCDKHPALDTNRVSTQHTHWVHTRARTIYAALNQLPASTRLSHFFDLDLEN
jgi:hypothetical protein